VNKSSPIYEGVTEIWINSQPCNGINRTTWHTWAREATRVPKVHDEAKKSCWVLPRPSNVFHAYASADTTWVVQTLSHCTHMTRGKISFNSSTHKATKFGDSICLVCVSTFKCLFIRAQPTHALTNTGGRYNHGAPNFRSDHSSSFPSSIRLFPPIAHPDSY
jgi:hypothetical protein